MSSYHSTLILATFCIYRIHNSASLSDAPMQDGKPQELKLDSGQTIIRKSMTQGAALSYCENRGSGGRLATLPTLDSAQTLVDAIKKASNAWTNDDDEAQYTFEFHMSRRYWIGLTDSVKEGDWVWLHEGSTLAYDEMWYGGQPDHPEKTKNEHCVTLWNPIFYEGEAHSFNDENCENKHYFICEDLTNPAGRSFAFQTNYTVDDENSSLPHGVTIDDDQVDRRIGVKVWRSEEETESEERNGQDSNLSNDTESDVDTEKRNATDGTTWGRALLLNDLDDSTFQNNKSDPQNMSYTAQPVSNSSESQAKAQVAPEQKVDVSLENQNVDASGSSTTEIDSKIDASNMENATNTTVNAAPENPKHVFGVGINDSSVEVLDSGSSMDNLDLEPENDTVWEESVSEHMAYSEGEGVTVTPEPNNESQKGGDTSQEINEEQVTVPEQEAEERSTVQSYSGDILTNTSNDSTTASNISLFEAKNDPLGKETTLSPEFTAVTETSPEMDNNNMVASKAESDEDGGKNQTDIPIQLPVLKKIQENFSEEYIEPEETKPAEETQAEHMEHMNLTTENRTFSEKSPENSTTPEESLSADDLHKLQKLQEEDEEAAQTDLDEAKPSPESLAEHKAHLQESEQERGPSQKYPHKQPTHTEHSSIEKPDKQSKKYLAASEPDLEQDEPRPPEEKEAVHKGHQKKPADEQESDEAKDKPMTFAEENEFEHIVHENEAIEMKLGKETTTTEAVPITEASWDESSEREQQLTEAENKSHISRMNGGEEMSNEPSAKARVKPDSGEKQGNVGESEKSTAELKTTEIELDTDAKQENSSILAQKNPSSAESLANKSQAKETEGDHKAHLGRTLDAEDGFQVPLTSTQKPHNTEAQSSESIRVGEVEGQTEAEQSKDATVLETEEEHATHINHDKENVTPKPAPSMILDAAETKAGEVEGNADIESQTSKNAPELEIEREGENKQQEENYRGEGKSTVDSEQTPKDTSGTRNETNPMTGIDNPEDEMEEVTEPAIPQETDEQHNAHILEDENTFKNTPTATKTNSNENFEKVMEAEEQGSTKPLQESEGDGIHKNPTQANKESLSKGKKGQTFPQETKEEHLAHTNGDEKDKGSLADVKLIPKVDEFKSQSGKETSSNTEVSSNIPETIPSSNEGITDISTTPEAATISEETEAEHLAHLGPNLEKEVTSGLRNGSSPEPDAKPIFDDQDFERVNEEEDNAKPPAETEAEHLDHVNRGQENWEISNKPLTPTHHKPSPVKNVDTADTRDHPDKETESEHLSHLNQIESTFQSLPTSDLTTPQLGLDQNDQTEDRQSGRKISGMVIPGAPGTENSVDMKQEIYNKTPEIQQDSYSTSETVSVSSDTSFESSAKTERVETSKDDKVNETEEIMSTDFNEDVEKSEATELDETKPPEESEAEHKAHLTDPEGKGNFEQGVGKSNANSSPNELMEKTKSPPETLMLEANTELARNFGETDADKSAPENSKITPNDLLTNPDNMEPVTEADLEEVMPPGETEEQHNAHIMGQLESSRSNDMSTTTPSFDENMEQLGKTEGNTGYTNKETIEKPTTPNENKKFPSTKSNEDLDKETNEKVEEMENALEDQATSKMEEEDEAREFESEDEHLAHLNRSKDKSTSSPPSTSSQSMSTSDENEMDAMKETESSKDKSTQMETEVEHQAHLSQGVSEHSTKTQIPKPSVNDKLENVEETQVPEIKKSSEEAYAEYSIQTSKESKSNSEENLKQYEKDTKRVKPVQESEAEHSAHLGKLENDVTSGSEDSSSGNIETDTKQNFNSITEKVESEADQEVTETFGGISSSGNDRDNPHWKNDKESAKNAGVKELNQNESQDVKSQLEENFHKSKSGFETEEEHNAHKIQVENKNVATPTDDEKIGQTLPPMEKAQSEQNVTETLNPKLGKDYVDNPLVKNDNDDGENTKLYDFKNLNEGNSQDTKSQTEKVPHKSQSGFETKEEHDAHKIQEKSTNAANSNPDVEDANKEKIPNQEFNETQEEPPEITTAGIKATEEEHNSHLSKNLHNTTKESDKKKPTSVEDSNRDSLKLRSGEVSDNEVTREADAFSEADSVTKQEEEAQSSQETIVEANTSKKEEISINDKNESIQETDADHIAHIDKGSKNEALKGQPESVTILNSEKSNSDAELEAERQTSLTGVETKEDHLFHLNEVSSNLPTANPAEFQDADTKPTFSKDSESDVVNADVSKSVNEERSDSDAEQLSNINQTIGKEDIPSHTSPETTLEPSTDVNSNEQNPSGRKLSDAELPKESETEHRAHLNAGEGHNKDLNFAHKKSSTSSKTKGFVGSNKDDADHSSRENQEKSPVASSEAPDTSEASAAIKSNHPKESEQEHKSHLTQLEGSTNFDNSRGVSKTKESLDIRKAETEVEESANESEVEHRANLKEDVEKSEASNDYSNQHEQSEPESEDIRPTKETEEEHKAHKNQAWPKSTFTTTNTTAIERPKVSIKKQEMETIQRNDSDDTSHETQDMDIIDYNNDDSAPDATGSSENRPPEESDAEHNAHMNQLSNKVNSSDNLQLSNQYKPANTKSSSTNNKQSEDKGAFETKEEHDAHLTEIKENEVIPPKVQKYDNLSKPDVTEEPKTEKPKETKEADLAHLKAPENSKQTVQESKNEKKQKPNEDSETGFPDSDEVGNEVSGDEDMPPKAKLDQPLSTSAKPEPIQGRSFDFGLIDVNNNDDDQEDAENDIEPVHLQETDDHPTGNQALEGTEEASNVTQRNTGKNKEIHKGNATSSQDNKASARLHWDKFSKSSKIPSNILKYRHSLKKGGALDTDGSPENTENTPVTNSNTSETITGLNQSDNQHNGTFRTPEIKENATAHKTPVESELKSAPTTPGPINKSSAEAKKSQPADFKTFDENNLNGNKTGATSEIRQEKLRNDSAQNIQGHKLTNDTLPKSPLSSQRNVISYGNKTFSKGKVENISQILKSSSKVIQPLDNINPKWNKLLDSSPYNRNTPQIIHTSKEISGEVEIGSPSKKQKFSPKETPKPKLNFTHPQPTPKAKASVWHTQKSVKTYTSTTATPRNQTKSQSPPDTSAEVELSAPPRSSMWNNSTPRNITVNTHVIDNTEFKAILRNHSKSEKEHVAKSNPTVPSSIKPKKTSGKNQSLAKGNIRNLWKTIKKDKSTTASKHTSGETTKDIELGSPPSRKADPQNSTTPSANPGLLNITKEKVEQNKSEIARKILATAMPHLDKDNTKGLWSKDMISMLKLDTRNYWKYSESKNRSTHSPNETSGEVETGSAPRRRPSENKKTHNFNTTRESRSFPRSGVHIDMEYFDNEPWEPKILPDHLKALHPELMLRGNRSSRVKRSHFKWVVTHFKPTSEINITLNSVAGNVTESNNASASKDDNDKEMIIPLNQSQSDFMQNPQNVSNLETTTTEETMDYFHQLPYSNNFDNATRQKRVPSKDNSENETQDSSQISAKPDLPKNGTNQTKNPNPTKKQGNQIAPNPTEPTPRPIIKVFTNIHNGNKLQNFAIINGRITNDIPIKFANRSRLFRNFTSSSDRRRNRNRGNDSDDSDVPKTRKKKDVRLEQYESAFLDLNMDSESALSSEENTKYDLRAKSTVRKGDRALNHKKFMTQFKGEPEASYHLLKNSKRKSFKSSSETSNEENFRDLFNFAILTTSPLQLPSIATTYHLQSILKNQVQFERDSVKMADSVNSHQKKENSRIFSAVDKPFSTSRLPLARKTISTPNLHSSIPVKQQAKAPNPVVKSDAKPATPKVISATPTPTERHLVLHLENAQKQSQKLSKPSSTILDGAKTPGKLKVDKALNYTIKPWKAGNESPPVKPRNSVSHLIKKHEEKIATVDRRTTLNGNAKSKAPAKPGVKSQTHLANGNNTKIGIERRSPDKHSNFNSSKILNENEKSAAPAQIAKNFGKTVTSNSGASSPSETIKPQVLRTNGVQGRAMLSDLITKTQQLKISTESKSQSQEIKKAPLQIKPLSKPSAKIVKKVLPKSSLENKENQQAHLGNKSILGRKKILSNKSKFTITTRSATTASFKAKNRSPSFITIPRIPSAPKPSTTPISKRLVGLVGREVKKLEKESKFQKGTDKGQSATLKRGLSKRRKSFASPAATSTRSFSSSTSTPTTIKEPLTTFKRPEVAMKPITTTTTNRKTPTVPPKEKVYFNLSNYSRKTFIPPAIIL